MTTGDPHSSPLFLRVAAVLILVAAMLVSDGFFSIDEAVYFLGSHALATQGNFVIENGYETYGAEVLKIWLLVAGPDGLVPQYPIGPMVIGAPFIGLLGARAFIIGNALAVAGLLFVTHELARKLYGDEKTALSSVFLLVFGTFTLEYAFGIWPHGWSMLAVATALLFTLRALDSVGRAHVFNTLAAGFVIGVGILFRIDTFLIVPVIAIIVILYARKPFQTGFWGLAGMAPGLGILLLSNWSKFGLINPLSYGAEDGDTLRPSGYLIAAGVIGAVGLFCLASRYVPAGKGRHYALIAMASLFVLCSAALADLRDFWFSYFRGFYVLFLDITPIRDPRPEVAQQPDGTVLFFGLSKAALFQSLPWLGIVAAAWARPMTVQEKRSIVIVAVTVLFWTLPFVIREWHGGLGNNLRYFLPILPLLCILAAHVWCTVFDGFVCSRKAILRMVIGGMAFAVLAMVVLPSGFVGVQQKLTTFIFLGMVLLSSTLYLPGMLKLVAVPLVRYAFVACVGVSLLMFAVSNLAVSQTHRATNAEIARTVEKLEGKVLAFGPPEFFVPLLLRTDGLVGLSRDIQAPDIHTFFKAAVADGYRLLLTEGQALQLTHLDKDFQMGEEFLEINTIKILEINVRDNAATTPRRLPSPEHRPLSWGQLSRSVSPRAPAVRTAKAAIRQKENAAPPGR